MAKKIDLKRIDIKRWLRYKYCRFIRIKDKPNNIAIGAALGVFFDVLPTFGLGVIFAYILAALMKVNRLATVISAVVFKLAIPFFVFINFKTGRIFIPFDRAVYSVTGSWFSVGWHKYGISFLLGSAINSVLLCGLVYFVTYHFVTWRRARAARNKN